jgi:opacity protein-like surface antigen
VLKNIINMNMKTNFKFFAITAILFLTAITASKAQNVAQVKTNDWRLGVVLNVPTGDASKAYSFTLGGDLKLQRDITESLSGTLTTGYTNFFIKKELKDLGAKDFGYIPLKAGIKVFPTKGIYISAELGAGFGVQKGSSTGFLYSPGVGIAFAKNYDISARYEAVSFKNDATIGQVALRLAYAFSL